VNVVIYPAYSGIVSGKDLLFNNETDILRLSLLGITKADVGNYIWYKDGVLVPGANGDSLVVNEAGEYCVDIIPAGADASACVVRACKLIQTELTKEVYIPNIFSPNDDGKNEIFTVEGGKNVDQITNISIYDRWGELVFLSGSFPLSRKYEFGWNGIFKGQKAMQGVYVYVVDVLYKDGTRETIGGDITLIR
jgi:gliding motility-associated-like protein